MFLRMDLESSYYETSESGDYGHEYYTDDNGENEDVDPDNMLYEVCYLTHYSIGSFYYFTSSFWSSLFIYKE